MNVRGFRLYMVSIILKLVFLTYMSLVCALFVLLSKSRVFQTFYIYDYFINRQGHNLKNINTVLLYFLEKMFTFYFIFFL